MDDDTEDHDGTEYDVVESLRSFRSASVKASEGIKHLYHGGKERLADQHVAVKGAFTFGLWFAGNWVYDRTAPLFVNSVTHVLSAVPIHATVSLVLGFLTGDVVLSTARLLGISTGALLGQNRLQTRKLKDIESKSTTMTGKQPTATDGGSRTPSTLVVAVASAVPSRASPSAFPSVPAACSPVRIWGTWSESA